MQREKPREDGVDGGHARLNIAIRLRRRESVGA